MTSCATVLLLSTLVILTKVESESRQFCAWFPTSVLRLRTELNGSRRSFLCVISNRHTKNVQKFYISFKGRKSAGLCAESAGLHNATQIVYRCFTYLRDSCLNSGQFDHRWKWFKTAFLMCALNPPQNEASWKRIETVCVWFPTSTPKLTVELNASRYALFADGIAVWDPVPNSTHLQRPKLEWGRLDRPHQERCPQFWGDVDGAQKCAPWFNSVLSPQVEMCLTDLMTGIKVRS